MVLLRMTKYKIPLKKKNIKKNYYLCRKIIV